jgi:hypothetical protein
MSPKPVTLIASYRPSFSGEVDVVVSLRDGHVTVNDSSFRVASGPCEALRESLIRLRVWERLESTPLGCDGLSVSARIECDSQTYDVEAWQPHPLRSPRAYELFVTVLDFVAALPLTDSLRREVSETREYFRVEPQVEPTVEVQSPLSALKHRLLGRLRGTPGVISLRLDGHEILVQVKSSPANVPGTIRGILEREFSGQPVRVVAAG